MRTADIEGIADTVEGSAFASASAAAEQQDLEWLRVSVLLLPL